ncbi:MAG: glutamate--tRNA ligase [Candidatus Peribacteraceae bacterium]|nr:glutamate--tRNA ligase [Candidatus Peribacteraceae bacterium]
MRTRFAPSPTGFLHVGGLRTALYSFLIARQTKGTFLLRIEDTDQARSVPGTVENILKTLDWAGIRPDEGVVPDNGQVAQKGAKGPYIQSERQGLGLYRKYADELVAKGHAYPCFCTSQRLEEMRKTQEAKKQAPMYDRLCLKLSAEEVRKRIAAGEPHVIRLKVPHERTITFTDEIRGEMRFQGHTIDDQVLLKSDGFPTYHLAHVADDRLMEIDLVIRGEEWLSSLPKHLLLFEYLGWPPPKYAHVPLLLNKDRSKLSKRQSAVAAEDYIAKGYLPEALLNFLALLGWNPGTTQELFSMDELVEAFSLDRVQKAGAVFDTEKLDWLQGQWMRKIPLKEFTVRIRPIVAGAYPAAAADPAFEKKAALIRERITFFAEAPAMLGYFYEEPQPTVELLANEKQKVTKALLPGALQKIEEILREIPEKEWNEERVLAAVKAEVAKGEWKLGQLLWPLRASLTGRPFSPGAVEVACALAAERGTEAVFERLERGKAVATR